MRVSDVRLHELRDIPEILETKRFIDYLMLAADPSRHGYSMVLRREYKQLQDAMAFQEQLPAWQQFAAARQGMG